MHIKISTDPPCVRTVVDGGTYFKIIFSFLFHYPHIILNLHPFSHDLTITETTFVHNYFTFRLFYIHLLN
ncbi:hypothetical protein EYC84_010802 [Monilinia fructicola]|uniref:Uncharacterized protein n=1 Tax=Monilinia fructicola TaxID=38448 RepID=A0A5M9JAX5_MONFR|nr:hypothetical protein EYC84_010802 [Monilinia fructicola]